MKLKDLISENAKSIKTHLVPINGIDTGITGFFDAELLLEHFAENEAEVVEYEKDYGSGVGVVIRRYLKIIVDSEETVEKFRRK